MEHLMSTDKNNSRAVQRHVHTSSDPHSADAGEQSPALLNVTEQLAFRAHQEALLDEAIEETFPASDPISPVWIRQNQ
jgi:hypothetical protein